MKRHQSMTIEQCAARMTAFLARKPRGKSRSYFASLPKRKAVIVQACDYAVQPVVPAKVEAVSAPILKPHKVRTERLRPRARWTQWHCRPKGARSSGLPSIGQRTPRDMATCAQHRFVLEAAQSGICALCGTPMYGDHSLDHCVPIAAGGADALGNLVLAHGECNGQKSDDAPTGCEAIWLFAVNAALGLEPTRW